MFPRKLPIGIQDFEYLRTNGFLYVDKTQYVYDLATFGKPYFLGRPRRFGKSLFLSTLKAYFEGKKELFEGLALSGLEKDWTEHPVIYLDFNTASYNTVETLNGVLDSVLKTYEKKWNLPPDSDIISVRFKNLIENAAGKFGQKVVVLIDEYDKSLINTMDKPQLNEEIRDVLKGFYGVLKAEDANLRFVFLTGVTKFSKVSIFSDLNQLQDISLDSKFSGICGITETELLNNFEPEIKNLAAKNNKSYNEICTGLKKRYDGYHFSENLEGVYNPFSLLNTFAQCTFRYYWFATGTPTFLAKHLKETGFDICKLENEVTISASSIMDYRVENRNYVPLLYQSGYLTIKSYDAIFDEYTLGYPNEEVKYGFLNELLPVFLPKITANDDFSVSRFTRTLLAGDIETFMQLLKAFYAYIPYDSIENAYKTEKYYQHIFYLLLTMMGQFVQAEVKTAQGRADAVVKLPEAIYIFEFKMANNGTAEDAIAQINDKHYAIPYSADGRKIVKIGAEFSDEERGLKRWIIE
ncbi:MAG: ATP-binding protein [Dysgonamonadaceae bacterium]|jgi:hypothetical protein|nr:ATP-binding protein [Dysgonamonadaceae bacterium]